MSKLSTTLVVAGCIVSAVLLAPWVGLLIKFAFAWFVWYCVVVFNFVLY